MPRREPEQQWSKPKGMLANGRFPLRVHRGGIAGGGEAAVLGRFRANGWYNNWRWPASTSVPTSTRRRTSAAASRSAG